ALPPWSMAISSAAARRENYRGWMRSSNASRFPVTPASATHAGPPMARPPKVAIVHNGIIENFRELREELIARGHSFESQTDSEVAAHLITDNMDRGMGPEEAAKAAVRRLTGAYSIAMIF